jgi:hypothetical protein
MDARWTQMLIRLVVLCLAVLAPPAAAQTDTGRVEPLRLLGIFDDASGDWIDRAVVRDTLGNETLTTRFGVATLNVLVPIAGFYLVEVRKEGYAPRRLRLRADSTYELMIALQRNRLGDAARLPAMVTTGKRLIVEDAGERSGFFNRCESGVTCIGRAELDRRPTAYLDNILGAKPGIHRECTKRSHGAVFNPAPNRPSEDDLVGCLITMRGTSGPGYCTPVYFVDGYEWQPLGGTVQAQLDKFLPPSRIEGIEVYLATEPHPVRFETGPFSGCGAVVIWTR